MQDIKEVLDKLDDIARRLERIESMVASPAEHKSNIAAAPDIKKQIDKMRAEMLAKHQKQIKEAQPAVAPYKGMEPGFLENKMQRRKLNLKQGKQDATGETSETGE